MIRIQPIENKHIDQLANFAAKQFSHYFAHLYEPEHLAKHLEDYYSAAYFASELKETAKIWIALDGEALVGYLKFGPMRLPLEHKPGSMEIRRMYVDPTLQRGGIGQQLMQAALETVGDGVDVYLGVWSENHLAQNFYTKQGFEKVGEYDYIVGPHRDHEFIMKRTC